MSEPVPVAAIDANVIIRYILRNDERLYALAEAILVAVDAGKVRVLCDPVILSEVVFVLTKTYEMPREEVAGGLIDILSSPGFLVPNKAHYLRALALLGTTVAHFGDACACAAALDETEGRLYSFDRKLSRVEGVTRLERVWRTD
ncbi:PIN domain-containing protein [bacterium]|nr:PIN domain-containing protein [bacterium]